MALSKHFSKYFSFLFGKCYDTGLGQNQGGSFPNLLPSNSGKAFVEDTDF